MTPHSSSKVGLLKFFHFLISLIGLSLIGLEIYLNSENASICTTEGCLLVHIFHNYGVLNYIGLIIFFYLFLISILDILNFRLDFFLKLRIYLLFICVIIEGYFIGFQTWFLNTYCLYCLIVASLLFLAFFLDYFYPEKGLEMFSIKKEKKRELYKLAIPGFVGIFLATWLVNFSLKPLDLSLPVLIYKEDCIRCKEVISYAKERNIKIKLYPVKDVIPLMKIVDVNGVPILLKKEGNNIVMVKGKEEIENLFEEKYGKKMKKEEIKDLKEKKAYQIEEKKEVREEKTGKFTVKESSNNTQLKVNFNVTNTQQESNACSIEKSCE